MAKPCYSGPIPVTDKERMAIWKWAKANGIDQGLPIDKVGDAINQHFFSGQAKPAWITDILSGRKTPFKYLATDAWKKQYNRRQIVQQAQSIANAKTPGPIGRAAGAIWSGPRSLAVFGHGLVFPITHGGDLALRPQSWGVFFKGLFDNYTKASVSKAATERLLDTMRRQPLFDTALRSGLDVGAKSHAGNLINRPEKGGMSTRAWDVLTTMRYNLWDNAMQKFAKPGMSQVETLEVGKQLAEWANHATGSAKGPIANLGGNVLFGPKLTQSKLNRLVADPVKTVMTFAHWAKATPGEKAVAWTRLSGSIQYATTMLGFLAANQGLNMALGKKDPKDQINFTDPNKSDFLAFKVGGIEWSMPGMHSELKTLGKILAVSFMDNKALRGESRQAKLGDIMGQYAMGRFNPAIGVAKDVMTGQNFMGRPMPWTSQTDAPGSLKRPRIGWLEYGLEHGPIPLTGPIGYFYDQMRAQEADPSHAINITKGLIMGAIDMTGVHAADANRPEIPKALLKEEATAHRRAAAAAKRKANIEKTLRGQ